MGLFLVVAITPYIVAWKQDTSIALATVLSLLLVTFYQMIIDMGFLDFTPIAFLSIIPKIAGHPDQIHRFITSAWLHANWIHVLGNILVTVEGGLLCRACRDFWYSKRNLSAGHWRNAADALVAHQAGAHAMRTTERDLRMDGLI